MSIGYRPFLLLAGATSMAFLSSISTARAADDELEEIPVLEEIIVTAEKREADVQKTALTVNVVSGKELAEAGVTEVADLQQMVPGLIIKKSNGSNEFTIRGVSAQATTPADQPSTAILVDGIYSQSTLASAGAFFDMERVEVLKGPQGTLFGRNATAGAISIVSKRPDFNGVSGQINADVGNYSKTNASAVLNVPVSDAVALRAALQTSKHDGYYKDGFNDEDTQSARLKVLIKPSDSVSLLLSGDYAEQKGKGDGAIAVDMNSGKPISSDAWKGPTATESQSVIYANKTVVGLGPGLTFQPVTNPFNGQYGLGAHLNNSSWGFGAQLDWDFGSFGSTTIASYRQSQRDDVTYVASLSSAYIQTIERSFETRLQSTDVDARLQWMGGLYYYDELLTGNALGASGIVANAQGQVVDSARAGGFNIDNLFAASYTSNLDNSTKNYAFFTQENFRVIDPLRLIGGIRAQHEEAKRGATRQQAWNVYLPNDAIIATDNTDPVVDVSWNSITWKAGVEYDVAENSMAYLTVATGWKAGAPLEYDAPYDQQKPEKLTAYALGIKNRFFEQRLQLNAEVFYWDYKDRQYSDRVSGGSGLYIDGAPVTSTAFVQLNAPKSIIQGASLEANAAITLHDTIGATVEFLDKSDYEQMGAFEALEGCVNTCRAANAPKWSGTLNYRHTFDLGDSGALVADLRSKLQSTTVMTLSKAAGPATTQGAYSMSNIGLAYSPKAAKWNVRAYVDNVEDRLVKSNVVAPVNTGNGATDFAVATYLAPRTYGVQMRVSF